MDNERCWRPSPEQLNALVDTLEVKPVQGKAWQKIAVRLNRMEGCVKNFKQWAKFWSDKKLMVRKKLMLANRSKSDPLAELSHVEQRIVDIMGGAERLIKGAEIQAKALREFHRSFKETKPTVKEDSPELDSVEQDHSYLVLNVKGDVQDEEGLAKYIYDSQEVPEQEITTDARLASPGPALSVASSGSDTQKVTTQRTHRKTVSRRFRRRLRFKRQTPRHTFARLTERFLRLKEKQLEIDRRNSQILETILEHEVERDKLITHALQMTAEGMRMVTEALKNKNNGFT